MATPILTDIKNSCSCNWSVISVCNNTVIYYYTVPNPPFQYFTKIFFFDKNYGLSIQFHQKNTDPIGTSVPSYVRMSKTISRVLYSMVIYLDLLLPVSSSNQPEDVTGSHMNPHYGLAPDGVYRAFYVAIEAVSSYLAFPPLPGT